MTKLTTTLTALLLILSCGARQTALTTTTEWDEDILKGKVKTVSTFIYNEDGEPGVSYVKQYNEAGRLLERTYFENGAVVKSHRLCSYDDKGNLVLIREIGYRQSEKGDTIDIVYEYNDSGLLTCQKELRNGALFYCVAKDYNEKGLLMLTTESDYDTETHYAYGYYYDSKDRLVKQETPYSYLTFEYDKDGKVASQKVYEAESNELLTTTTLGYDSSGRLIQEVCSDAEGPSTIGYSSIMSYDDQNRLVELKLTDDDGMVERHITYTYDERGNMATLEKLLDHALRRELSTYTYDEQGNWTEAEHNFDGVVLRVVRTITYY